MKNSENFLNYFRNKIWHIDYFVITPSELLIAHVPNLHMGNLVLGIFGAKFVNF